MSLRRILVILDSPPKYGYYCDYIYPVTGSDGRRAPKRHGTPVQNDQNIQNSPTRPWSRPCSLSKRRRRRLFSRARGASEGPDLLAGAFVSFMGFRGEHTKPGSPSVR